jgi:hypothetical protein
LVAAVRSSFARSEIRRRRGSGLGVPDRRRCGGDPGGLGAPRHRADRGSGAIGGLLNVSFGSIAELVLAVFVLMQGQAAVVQAQITGSIIGTLALLSWFVGHPMSLVLSVPSTCLQSPGQHSLSGR